MEARLEAQLCLLRAFILILLVILNYIVIKRSPRGVVAVKWQLLSQQEYGGEGCGSAVGLFLTVLAKLDTDRKQGRKERVGETDPSVWLSGMFLCQSVQAESSLLTIHLTQ